MPRFSLPSFASHQGRFRSQAQQTNQGVAQDIEVEPRHFYAATRLGRSAREYPAKHSDFRDLGVVEMLEDGPGYYKFLRNEMNCIYLGHREA